MRNLKEVLRKAFKKELPGDKAHKIVAPYQRKSTSEALQTAKDYREAAVMLTLYPYHEKWYFILIQRPAYDGVHGGQISLPGGKRDPDDYNFQQTAVRETMEEVGVDIKTEEVLGKLTDVFIPPSNMLVKVFVSVLDDKPHMTPNEYEVDEILEIKLESLLKENALQVKKMNIGKESKSKISIDVPYFNLEGHTVWGATALILSEFREMIK